MPPVGFDPTIAVGKWPKAYALDRANTGIGHEKTYLKQNRAYISGTAKNKQNKSNVLFLVLFTEGYTSIHTALRRQAKKIFQVSIKIWLVFLSERAILRCCNIVSLQKPYAYSAALYV